MFIHRSLFRRTFETVRLAFCSKGALSKILGEKDLTAIDSDCSGVVGCVHDESR